MSDFRPIRFQPNVNTPRINKKKTEDKKEQAIENNPTPAIISKDIGSKALDYLAATSFQGLQKSEAKTTSATPELASVSAVDADRISKSMGDFEALFQERTQHVNNALKEIPGSDKLSDNARMYLVSECINNVDLGSSLDDLEF